MTHYLVFRKSFYNMFLVIIANNFCSYLLLSKECGGDSSPEAWLLAWTACAAAAAALAAAAAALAMAFMSGKAAADPRPRICSMIAEWLRKGGKRSPPANDKRSPPVRDKRSPPEFTRSALNMEDRDWSRSEGVWGVKVGEFDAEGVLDWTPLGGLRRWYSSSSTVQTAPLTFSTRMKHLWRLKLWRTAFCKAEKTLLSICKNCEFVIIVQNKNACSS